MPKAGPSLTSTTSGMDAFSDCHLAISGRRVAQCMQRERVNMSTTSSRPLNRERSVTSRSSHDCRENGGTGSPTARPELLRDRLELAIGDDRISRLSKRSWRSSNFLVSLILEYRLTQMATVKRAIATAAAIASSDGAVLSARTTFVGPATAMLTAIAVRKALRTMADLPTAPLESGPKHWQATWSPLSRTLAKASEKQVSMAVAAHAERTTAAGHKRPMARPTSSNITDVAISRLHRAEAPRSVAARTAAGQVFTFASAVQANTVAKATCIVPIRIAVVFTSASPIQASNAWNSSTLLPCNFLALA